MTMDQIRYFLEVAYCKNFSTAAQNLYISQPNLTRYIASMEKELGAKLFDRTTRRVELTEYGEQLLSRAETLFMPFLRSYEDLQADISNRRRAIYVGVPRDEKLPDEVMETIQRLNLTYPDRAYLLYHDSHRGLITGLQNRKYNLIISSDRNSRHLVGTEHFELQPLHMVLAISVNHPLSAKPGLTPADLRDDIIFFSMPRGLVSTEELAQSLYHRVGSVMNIKLLDSHSDVLACVQSCAGAAIIPDLVDMDAYPDIQFLPFHDNRSDSAWQSMVWRSSESDPSVRELIDGIVERYSEKP